MNSLTLSAQDSTSVSFQKWIDEVVITSKRPLYQNRADVMIYDVSADSTLIGKSSFDALRNAPMLIVERNGKVRAMGNYSIEYRVNGLRDNILSGNIRDATESLQAKYLKRIEVRFERNIDGSEKLQVNFVTKGVIYGYRGSVSSEIADDRWRNGFYIFTKKGKWALNLSYFNLWEWGHNSISDNDEYRYNISDLYHTVRHSDRKGYKVDMNNIEVTLNYEATPLSVFTLYGRALMKINPRNYEKSTRTSFAENGDITYRYDKETTDRMNDGEYSFSAEYERLFGENAKRGKFYVGYDFYRRPIENNKEAVYTALTSTDKKYVSDFFNMTETSKEVEDWHTLSSSYRRKFNRHTLNIEEFLRYRDEHDENKQNQRFDYAENPYEKLDWSDFTHRQLANMLQTSYTYNIQKMQFRLGGTWTYLHDFVRNKELDNEFKTNYRYVVPYVDISYSPNWKFNIRLAYSMSKQIPSITALNPYVYKNVAGELSYGNPDLKPQTSNSLSLSSNLQIGKLRFYGELTNSFSKDLMLRHSFLKDGMLHNTTDNMGKRYDFNIRTNVSSKFTRTSWARI